MRLDCECGFVARGAGGDELVAVAQAHARDAHVVDLTAEVILALADVSADPHLRLRSALWQGVDHER